MSTELQNKETSCNAGAEIDLLDLTRKLWDRRKLVVRITVCFIFVGLLVALFSPKIYTASCVVVPQTSKTNASSGMARLASLAGIDMGNITTGEQLLSPMLYPNILKSSAFQRDLLRTELHLEGEEAPVTLINYLTDKKYRKFSLKTTVLKYTIGLPGVIKGAFSNTENNAPQFQPGEAGIIVLTRTERQAVEALQNIVLMNLNQKNGYLTVTTQMNQPYAAAEVAESTVGLLQQYITEFKIEKVQQNLEFIQGRYDELKNEYEQVQLTRARFRDANQNMVSNRVRSEMERLDNQYTLAYGVFSQIATQLEQAKIEVKENTPILTVIEPVTVPSIPSKPRRMTILAGFTFLGVFAGCGYVLLFPYFRQAFRAIRKEEE